LAIPPNTLESLLIATGGITTRYLNDLSTRY
jgi:hypothetical protein